MKSLTIALPDKAFVVAQAKAAELGIDATAFCCSLLADNLLGDEPPSRPKAAHVLSSTQILNTKTCKFDVVSEFPGFPTKSIEFAQRILNEVFKLPDVEVRRDRYGIAIRPNFIWIEALLSKAGRAGVRVSFYDKNGESRHSLPLLKRGQGNYSRAVVENASDLEAILPLVRRAYELKFGIR
jgi:hypothetical protein